MKKVIFLMMLVFSLPTFANNNVQNVTNNVENIVEKSSQTVDKLIDGSNKLMVKGDSILSNTSLNVTLPDTVNNKYYNDIKQFLITTGKALGIAADTVFNVIVKQQLVKSIAYSIGYISLIILLISRIKAFNKWRTDNPHDDIIDGSGGMANIVAGVIITILLIIFSSNCIIPMITGYINPEFGAYQDILSFIQQIK